MPSEPALSEVEGHTAYIDAPSAFRRRTSLIGRPSSFHGLISPQTLLRVNQIARKRQSEQNGQDGDHIHEKSRRLKRSRIQL
jgi:hypothetical protein